MKKHLFLMMIAVAALTFAGCSESDDAPALAIDKTAIDAAFTAGSYTVAVTSNAAWSATVSAGAAWCTLSPASATGNGTLNVNVTENSATVSRAATVTVTAGTASKTVSVMQDVLPTPPHAASTQIWVFGEQIWSDAIRIPECDKTDFADSDTELQCRSYTSGTNTWYYYNWPYVTANATALCPSPWRVPTESDFNTLKSNTNYSTLISEWGYGGLATSSSMDSVSEVAFYWSSTEYPDNTNYAYTLYYYSGDLVMDSAYKRAGMQVRCVR
jgi:hypothetical protein